MSSEIYDVVVVGAGIIGSATAYTIACQGVRTLLIDQFELPHSRGSSHGLSRIIRYADPRPKNASVMSEAFKLWADLEKVSKKEIFKKTGFLVFGQKDGKSIIETEKVMSDLGVPFSKYEGSELSQRYPQFLFRNNEIGLLDHEAGIIKSDVALSTYWEMFKKEGGVICAGVTVSDVIPGDIITLKTSKGHFKSKSLVIAAGSFANKLIRPLGIPLPLNPLTVKVCFWSVCDHANKGSYTADSCPAFYCDTPDGDHDFFGIPSFEYPGMFKVCPMSYGTAIEDSKERHVNLLYQKDLQDTRNFLRTRMPGLDHNGPTIFETCIYTKTPDMDCVIDVHPIWKNIVIGAGFSGHGFKSAPVTGKLLSELALQKTPSYDISPYRLDRFASSSRLSNAKL